MHSRRKLMSIAQVLGTWPGGSPSSAPFPSSERRAHDRYEAGRLCLTTESITFLPSQITLWLSSRQLFISTSICPRPLEKGSDLVTKLCASTLSKPKGLRRLVSAVGRLWRKLFLCSFIHALSVTHQP